MKADENVQLFVKSFSLTHEQEAAAESRRGDDADYDDERKEVLPMTATVLSGCPGFLLTNATSCLSADNRKSCALMSKSIASDVLVNKQELKII